MEDNYNYILENLAKHNLCTYYILPLLRLSFRDFGGETNFKNSYLSKDCKKIYVQVVNPLFVWKGYAPHKVHNLETSDVYIELDIPSEFEDDVQNFLKGKYSQLSNDAKRMIITHSGLLWRRMLPGETLPITDIRLLALDKGNSDLKVFWEKVIGTELDPDTELMSKPEENTFLDLV